MAQRPLPCLRVVFVYWCFVYSSFLCVFASFCGNSSWYMFCYYEERSAVSAARRIPQLTWLGGSNLLAMCSPSTLKWHGSTATTMSPSGLCGMRTGKGPTTTSKDGIIKIDKLAGKPSKHLRARRPIQDWRSSDWSDSEAARSWRGACTDTQGVQAEGEKTEDQSSKIL